MALLSTVPSDRDPPARGLPARQQADMDDDEGVAFEGETIKPLVERVRCPRALFRGPAQGGACTPLTVIVMVLWLSGHSSP